MHYDDKYYSTDSHLCGPKGAPAKDGRACIIECDIILYMIMGQQMYNHFLYRHL